MSLVSNERFQIAIKRLRGNPDFEEVTEYLRRSLEDRTTDLIFLMDPVATHRAQGAVAELRSILADLVP